MRIEGLDPSRQQALELHLKQRIHNHQWLSKCLEGSYENFPHRLSKTISGRVDWEHLCTASHLPKMKPECKDPSAPTYLINIPTRSQCVSILKLLQTESFGTTAEASRQIVADRVAVVIGMNQAKSLDQDKNNNFFQEIANLQVVQGIAYRVFGFFWDPKWETPAHHEHLYTRDKSYRLFKVIAPNKRSNLLEYIEHQSFLEAQVPYQSIRECIKTSRASQGFAKHFEDRAPQSFTYYGVMDDDARSLRENIGLFSLVDEVIKTQKAPSAITFGYRVKDNRRPTIELSVKIDMAVREAMNSTIPYAAYLPEPASFFCIRRPPESHFLSQLSFIGVGSRLETRRLIQSGRQANLFDNNVVFRSEGGPLTTIPERMETIKNSSLTFPQLGQKKFLKSMRGLPQTHATPKQWADNLYPALNFSVSVVADVTTPMMLLFNVYDPISQAFSQPGRYSKKNFNKVMKEYKSSNLSDSQQNIQQTAKMRLEALGMKPDMINKIIEAAKASGKAIFNTLKNALPDPVS